MFKLNQFVSLLAVPATLMLASCNMQLPGGLPPSEVGVLTDGTTSKVRSPYPSCSADDMKWMGLSFARDRYLFANELPVAVDLAAYADTNEMIKAIRIEEKDPFSFALTGKEHQDSNVSGVYTGFGFSWVLDETESVRYVSRVHDGPAYAAGMRRGDRIVAINGHSAAEVDELFKANQAATVWTHPEGKEGTDFTWQDYEGNEFSAYIVEDEINLIDVQDYRLIAEASVPTGYLSYQRFKSYSEDELDAALNYFKQQNISELVIDLRYNGGGLIRLAQKIASTLISTEDQGKDLIFYDYLGTDGGKHTFDLDYMTDRTLPVLDIDSPLDLSRVFILTTGRSCSASEMLINILSPYVEVIQIGETTCGKPLGMHGTSYCSGGNDQDGEIWFFVNFEVKNGVGEGGYYNGLTPDCEIAESKIYPWGNVQDALLKTAMHYMDTGQCSAQAAQQSRSAQSVRQLNQAPTERDYSSAYRLVDHL